MTVMIYELSSPTSERKEEKNRQGKVLDGIKWKQNRNWLQRLGNGILQSRAGSLGEEKRANVEKKKTGKFFSN